jgi:hypothetical protein
MLRKRMQLRQTKGRHPLSALSNADLLFVVLFDVCFVRDSGALAPSDRPVITGALAGRQAFSVSTLASEVYGRLLVSTPSSTMETLPTETQPQQPSMETDTLPQSQPPQQYPGAEPFVDGDFPKKTTELTRRGGCDVSKIISDLSAIEMPLECLDFSWIDVDEVLTLEFLDFWTKTMSPNVTCMRLSYRTCSIASLITLLRLSRKLWDIDVQTATNGLVCLQYPSVPSVIEKFPDMMVIRRFNGAEKPAKDAVPYEGLGELTRICLEQCLVGHILELASQDLQELHLLPTMDDFTLQITDASIQGIVSRFPKLRTLSYPFIDVQSDLLSKTVSHLTLYLYMSFSQSYTPLPSCPYVTHLVLMTAGTYSVSVDKWSGSSWTSLTHLGLVRVNVTRPIPLPPKLEVIEYYGPHWGLFLETTHESLHTIIINKTNLTTEDIKVFCRFLPNVKTIRLRNCNVKESGKEYFYMEDSDEYSDANAYDTCPSNVFFETCTFIRNNKDIQE